MPNDIKGIHSNRTQQSTDKPVHNLQRDMRGQSQDAAGVQHDKGDTVRLTEMASRLRSLEQKLTQQPEVDQDRVEQVRNAISSGEFRVDPARVADKIMDFEADFQHDQS